MTDDWRPGTIDLTWVERVGGRFPVKNGKKKDEEDKDKNQNQGNWEDKLMV